MLIDLTQRHVGLGYPLLVPFSSRDFELGVMGSEATVPWAPAIAAFTVGLWGLRRWWDRRGAPRPDAGAEGQRGEPRG